MPVPGFLEQTLAGIRQSQLQRGSLAPALNPQAVTATDFDIGTRPGRPEVSGQPFEVAGASQAGIAANDRIMQAQQAQQALEQKNALAQAVGLGKSLKSIAGIPGVKGALGIGGGTAAASGIAGGGTLGAAGAGTVGGASGTVGAGGLGAGGGGLAAGAAGGPVAAPAFGAGATTFGGAVAGPALAVLGTTLAFKGAADLAKNFGLIQGGPEEEEFRFGTNDDGEFSMLHKDRIPFQETVDFFGDFTNRAITAAGLDPTDLKGRIGRKGGEYAVWRENKNGDVISKPTKFGSYEAALDNFLRHNGSNVDISELQAPDFAAIELEHTQKRIADIMAVGQQGGSDGASADFNEAIRQASRQTFSPNFVEQRDSGSGFNDGP